MSERIKIDDTYTYVYDNGSVSLERHGTQWLATPDAPKAWIAAANEIEELRATVDSLTQQIEADADVIFMQQDQIEQLNRVNAHLESRTIDIPESR